MKTLKITTPNLLKFLLALSLILNFTSCSKDDSILTPFVDSIPASMLRTYTGPLSYTPEGAEELFFQAGTAMLSGSNGNYTITFSNDIPSLTGLSFNRVGPINFEYSEGDNEIIINTILTLEFTKNGNFIEFTGF